ncbi:hypothetical protein GUJ93_ZPchr0003g17581 [Zizania palustris]|uniref:Uncharacterized protein n=1 Tax=Zizania palustris TaxID=103762 RepID=A0A8J5S6C2_ZIZPA|nr:hypothetical protein GUJ93_ZPchr0003g17581 [Zizania palustris]
MPRFVAPSQPQQPYHHHPAGNPIVALLPPYRRSDPLPHRSPVATMPRSGGYRLDHNTAILAHVLLATVHHVRSACIDHVRSSIPIKHCLLLIEAPPSEAQRGEQTRQGRRRGKRGLKFRFGAISLTYVLQFWMNVDFVRLSPLNS